MKYLLIPLLTSAMILLSGCFKSESSPSIEQNFGGGSISGTISIALNNLVDVDTRDPSESNKNNNTSETAQALTSETLLSGIVDSKDPVDFYQVQLQENQRLMVQVADESNDSYDIVKLSLFSTSEENSTQFITSVETTAETGRFDASLVVQDGGVYFIKIEAINPSSSGVNNQYDHGIYTLSIDAARAGSSAEFALGEVNVLLKPDRQYMAQGLRTAMDLGRFKKLSLDDARALMGNAKITYASTSTSSSSSNTSMANTKLKQQRWEVLQAVEILSQHEDIEIAEPNWKRYAFSSPVINDPYYSSQWHYDTINLPQAWEELGTNRGEGVVVAVVDTGVLTKHPDLEGNLIPGYDYVDNDADANDPGDKSINDQRSSFHGTHVAGTIAALANDRGGIGIAPDVKIMPIRVLGEDGGYSSDIIAGVCFAAQLQASTQVGCGNTNTAANAADVINLSLGGEGHSEMEQDVFNAVKNKGIIVIAAAGNLGVSEPFYPAAYDSVISVSAVSQELTQASYSNFADPAKNSKIDVAAPGGDFTKDKGIYSTLGDDSRGETVFTYGSLQGTSMAAPHVAGIVALMKSVKADLTPVEFLSDLNNGKLTQDLGDEGKDNYFGNGLIDAHKAVLSVKDSINDIAQLLSSHNQLFFNITQSELSFLLSAHGVESETEVGDLAVVSDSAWLTVRKESDSSDSSGNTVGLGSNIVTVNRTELDEGSYEGRLTISSESNAELESITIKVTLQIGNTNISSNAGVQYVLVIDENDEVVAGSAALISTGGKYSYEIIGELPKGKYLVATGSDLDLDGNICDAGESCGQYPTLDRPITIEITEQQSVIENVNMTVGFMDIQDSYSTANSSDSGGTSSTPKVFKGYKIPFRETAIEDNGSEDISVNNPSLKTMSMKSGESQ